jgi:hypothetical protein
MPPCAFIRAHWARATTWAISFWAIHRLSEPQLFPLCTGPRCAPPHRGVSMTSDTAFSRHHRRGSAAARRCRDRQSRCCRRRGFGVELQAPHKIDRHHYRSAHEASDARGVVHTERVTWFEGLWSAYALVSPRFGCRCCYVFSCSLALLGCMVLAAQLASRVRASWVGDPGSAV